MKKIVNLMTVVIAMADYPLVDVEPGPRFGRSGAQTLSAAWKVGLLRSMPANGPPPPCWPWGIEVGTFTP